MHAATSWLLAATSGFCHSLHVLVGSLSRQGAPAWSSGARRTAKSVVGDDMLGIARRLLAIFPEPTPASREACLRLGCCSLNLHGICRLEPKTRRHLTSSQAQNHREGLEHQWRVQCAACSSSPTSQLHKARCAAKHCSRSGFCVERIRL